MDFWPPARVSEVLYSWLPYERWKIWTAWGSIHSAWHERIWWCLTLLRIGHCTSLAGIRGCLQHALVGRVYSLHACQFSLRCLSQGVLGSLFPRWWSALDPWLVCCVSHSPLYLPHVQLVGIHLTCMSSSRHRIFTLALRNTTLELLFWWLLYLAPCWVRYG